MRTVHRCHSAFLPVENRSTDYRPISTAAPWPIRPGEDGPLRQTWAMDQTSITAAGAIDTFLVLLIGIGPKLALVPFLEITAPLDDATKRRVQRKMLTTAATVAVLLMVLGRIAAHAAALHDRIVVDRRRRDVACARRMDGARAAVWR